MGVPEVTVKAEDYPNCTKLKEHGDEWDHIYPFMEWLQEKRYSLCRYETKEEAIERGSVSRSTGEPWLYEYPIPVGRSITDLLYEYLGIDPVKLERERRALLELMRKMNQPK